MAKPRTSLCRKQFMLANARSAFNHVLNPTKAFTSHLVHNFKLIAWAN